MDSIVKLMGLAFVFTLFVMGCKSDASQKEVVQQEQKELKEYSASDDRLPPDDIALSLPDALMEMYKVTGTSGTSNMADGTEVSMARRVYREGDKELVLEIRDTGVLGKTMDSYLNWMNRPIDLANESLIEKYYLTDDGFPAYDKYLVKEKTGEVHILPHRRFEIVVRGKNVTLDELKQALKEWDVKHSVSTLK